MNTEVENNSRIAKNTLFLYMRMLLSIVVNLYTVRVIWQVLGLDNYGIYNVVGGIVMMFAFLNNAMVASSQRFLSFELGTGDFERLKKIFSLSVIIHVILAAIILVLAETAGLWFLNAKLNIPAARMGAANWVYQFSILAFMINVVSVPYNACIVAHEHMKIYGYFGILEVLLKLVIVYLLIVIPFDKLITYAALVATVAIAMRLIYGAYCRRHFPECRFKYVSDHHLMKDMFSFAGWSFLGNMGFSVRDQGLNIVLNMFFGVALNAARGVALQISGVISGFAQSFQMALNPQITKRYAAGLKDSMITLIMQGCKYSGLLMTMIIVPLFISCDLVLHLWLDTVAPYTVGFMRLILIVAFIDSFVSPITTGLQATGRIKWFQIIISIIMVSTIPVAWIWLKFDNDPYIITYVSILSAFVALISRIILLHREVSFSYWKFIKNVGFRPIAILLISGCLSAWIWPLYPQNIWGFLLFGISSVAIVSSLSLLIGLTRSERSVVYEKVIAKTKGRF